jgi:hypothetical protein
MARSRASRARSHRPDCAVRLLRTIQPTPSGASLYLAAMSPGAAAPTTAAPTADVTAPTPAAAAPTRTARYDAGCVGVAWPRVCSRET